MKKLSKALFTVLFFTLYFPIQAQVNPPGPSCFGGPTTIQDGEPCCLSPGACGPTCPTCVPVPLNGETSMLLIAGLFLGVIVLKRQS
jgi:hypothetical protein